MRTDAPGIELELAGGDDLLAGGKAEGDGDAVLAHLAGAHEAALGDELLAGRLAGRGRRRRRPPSAGAGFTT